MRIIPTLFVIAILSQNLNANATVKFPEISIDKELNSKTILDNFLNDNSLSQIDDPPSIHKMIIHNHEKLLEDPSSIKPLITLSRIYLILGQIQETSYFSHQVLKVNPQHDAALFLAALSDMKEKQIDEALKHLFQLLKIHPHDKRVIRLTAGLLANNNQPIDAIEMLEPFVKNHPLNIVAAYELGTLYVLVGRKQEGIEYIKLASLHFPEDIKILRNLTAAYFSNKQYKECIETIKIIINLIPSSFRERRLLAGLYMIQEDYINADYQIELLLRLDDRSVDTMFILSCMYVVEENWNDALKLTNTILERKGKLIPAKVLKYFILKNMKESEKANSLKNDPLVLSFWRKIMNQKRTTGNQLVTILLTETFSAEEMPQNSMKNGGLEQTNE